MTTQMVSPQRRGAITDVPDRLPVVRITGRDRVVRAGVAAVLDTDVAVAPDGHAEPGDVVVAVVESIPEQVAALRAAPHAPGEHLLVIAGRLDAPAVALAVRIGALGVLRRADVDPSTLSRSVCAVARGEAVVPPDLLGQLLADPGDPEAGVAQPPSLSVVRLSVREREVLRFLADGADTRQIARSLRYSERTVKTVIQDITRRFGLRNRAHAVAYALRNGLI